MPLDCSRYLVGGIKQVNITCNLALSAANPLNGFWSARLYSLCEQSASIEGLYLPGSLIGKSTVIGA